MPWPLGNTKVVEPEPQPKPAPPAPQPDEFKTKFDEFINSFGSFKTNVEAKLAELETRTATPPSPTVNQPQPGNPPSSPSEEPIDFWTDPGRAVDNQIRKVVTPVLKETLELRARMVYDKVSSKFGSQWEWFKDELDKHLKQVPLLNAADETYVENCFRVIRDHHQDDIKAGKYNQLLDGKSGTPTNEPEKPADQQLSAEELAIAKRYGTSPADYLKQKKELDLPMIRRIS